jgi:hypothetical protein
MLDGITRKLLPAAPDQNQAKSSGEIEIPATEPRPDGAA